jgi:2-oxoisovalerate dehydrogenase E1 component beta subunit
MMGMRPVAEMQFIDFISCAFDMITNFAAKSRYRTGVGVPLVIRGPSGGGVHGGPFHSQNPEAYFAHTPGLKVVQPATAYDAKGLIKAAIRDDDPVLFFEHKFLYRRIKEELPAGDWIVPLGKAAVRREGRDLSVITYGAMVWTALEAARTLEAEGIDVETWRSSSPSTDHGLESVAKTNRRSCSTRPRARAGSAPRSRPFSPNAASSISTGLSCASPRRTLPCRTRPRSKSSSCPTPRSSAGRRGRLRPTDPNPP